MVAREDDVDIEVMRERLTPQRIDDALGHLAELEQVLAPLQPRTEDEFLHDVLRALKIVRDALEDALDD